MAKNDRWTDVEMTMISENPEFSNEELSKQLEGRTPAAIGWRRRNMPERYKPSVKSFEIDAAEKEKVEQMKAKNGTYKPANVSNLASQITKIKENITDSVINVPVLPSIANASEKTAPKTDNSQTELEDALKQQIREQENTIAWHKGVLIGIEMILDHLLKMEGKYD